MKKLFLALIYSLCYFSLHAQINNPTQLNGLKLWLTADSGVVVSSGTNVSQWTDLSGNNNSAIQTIQSNQATVITNTINGKPVLSFNGSSSFLLTPSGMLNNWSAISIFAVIKLKVNKNGGIFGSNLGYSDLELTSQANGSVRILNNSYSTTIVANDLLTLNNWCLISVVGVNANGSAWKNTADITQNKGTTRLPISNGIQQALGRYAGSFYANFDIAEFIIYDSALTTIQRINVENYLHNKYAPPVNLGSDITVSNNFCNVTLDATAGYTSYLWSTGASTQTVSVNKTSDYWVQTTDIFGLTSRDTIHVNYPDGSYKGNNYVCLGSTKQWNTFLPKNKYTFKWQDNSSDSLFTITTPGTYSVTVSDLLACKTSYSLVVSLDNFPATASLGNDTGLCAGNLIYLKSGAPATGSYLWSDATTNDSLAIFSTGQYSLIATDVNGCIKKDSITITIVGVAPTANFSFDTACFGSPNHFIDLSSPLPSTNLITSRYWSFGDLNVLDTSATAFTHTYADTGSYKVKLTITTDVGCSAEKTTTIHVSPYPIVTYTASNLCENAVVQFFGTATTFNYPISKWTWDFADPDSGINNTSSLQNTTHNFGVYGSYNVQLIGKNAYGCADTAINNLSINASPAINFVYSLACVNDVVQFTDVTPNSPMFYIQNYYWNFGDLVTSALPNPIHAFATNKTYTVRYIVSASNGCVDSMIVPLVVNAKAVTAFSATNTCVNSLTRFTDTSKIAAGSISSRKWDFGDNTFSALPNPQHTYADTLSARVKLVTTSNKGCKDSLTKTVYIRPSPKADFTINPPYGSPPLTVTFNNNSSGATNYLWNIDTSTSSNSNPQYTFTNIGSYTAQLTASTNFGCVSVLSKTIEVSTEHIDVAIQNLSTGLQNNYLTISAQLLNHSSTDITSMDILIEVSGIAAIKEKWTGVLVKDGLLEYNIPSSVYAGDENHFVCVTLQNPNGLPDDVPDNNNTCKAANEAAFQILSPYPNPTRGTLTMPIVIPEGNTLTIALYNILGQQVQKLYSGTIAKGLQLLNADFANLESGVYTLKFEYKGEVIVKKFMKE
jgi:PKD repeat protein